MKFQNFLSNNFFSFFNNRKQGLSFLFFNITGNAFTFLLNFTLPFFLTIEGYGYFALLFALHNVIIAFFTFGLDASIVKFAIEKKTSSNTLYISFFAWIIMSLVLIPIFLLLAWFVVKMKFLDIDFKPIVLIIISAMMISYQRIVLAYYIATSSVKKYGKLFIINKLFQFILILSIIFIYAESISLNVLPFIFLMQGIFVFGYILIFIFNKEINLKVVPTKKEVTELIKFTLPLSINTIGNLGYSYGFNVFVSPFLTFGQLGVLNIFTQLGSVSMLTINALNSGYIPRFYKDYYFSIKTAVIKYFKYIYQNALIIILFILIVSLIYKYYAYSASIDFSIFNLGIYLIGILLYSFKSIGSNYLIIENKTFRISLITLFTSILNILIGILLTKTWGFGGCIISLTFGYFIQVLCFNYDVIMNLKKHKI